MKINSERLEALLFEMLARVRSGDCDWVAMCIQEQDGVQVQVRVTSDSNDFLGVVSPGVIEDPWPLQMKKPAAANAGRV